MPAPDPPTGRDLAALAREQHGVVTRADLLGRGFSSARVQRRIADGGLHPQHRGVHAVGSGRLTPVGATYAGVRAVGDGACACAGSAAGLRELGTSLPPVPHVLTTRAVRGPAGVVLHRTRLLLPADVSEVDGIPAVSVTRLLLDAADGGRSPLRALAEAGPADA